MSLYGVIGYRVTTCGNFDLFITNLFILYKGWYVTFNSYRTEIFWYKLWLTKNYSLRIICSFQLHLHTYFKGKVLDTYNPLNASSLSSFLAPTDSWNSRICAMRIEPPSSLANSDSPDDLTWVWPPHYSQWTCDVIINIHVVRTPPVRTAVRHTCCQGQTSGPTVRPDGARWLNATSFVLNIFLARLLIFN